MAAFGQTGSIWVKLVLFGQISSIWEIWIYLGQRGSLSGSI